MRCALLLLLASWAMAEDPADRIRELSSPDVLARRDAAQALGASAGSDAAIAALREALLDDDPLVREAAARSLGRLGAATAADDLDRAAEDGIDSVRLAALGALARLGEAGVPRLVAHIKDRASRADAFEALAALGSDAYSAVVALLGEPSWHVREWTLQSVDPRTPVPDAYVDAVVRCLVADPSEAVRRAAAGRLVGSLGENARARAHAREELRAKDPYVRVTCAAALARGALDDATVAALAAATADREPAVAVRAALALRSAGDHRDAALPALGAALGDVDPRVRTAAAAALGFLGKYPDKAVPVLLDAVRAYDAEPPYPHDRNLQAGHGLDLTPPDPLPLAVDALLRKGSGAVPLLAPLAREGPVEERVHAIWALGRLQPDATDVLRGALDATEPDIRREAAACLVASGTNDPAALLVLAADLADASRREEASLVLTKAGAAAVPALLDFARAEFRRANPGGTVRSGDTVTAVIPDVFEEILFVLLGIGEPGADALGKARDDPEVGSLAAEALRQIRR
jgi:HEAT repeat protein